MIKAIAKKKKFDLSMQTTVSSKMCNWHGKVVPKFSEQYLINLRPMVVISLNERSKKNSNNQLNEREFKIEIEMKQKYWIEWERREETETNEKPKNTQLKFIN